MSKGVLSKMAKAFRHVNTGLFRFQHTWQSALVALVLSISIGGGTSAQTDTCSTETALSVARAASACTAAPVGYGCYGGGVVTNELRNNADSAPLSQPGDITPLRDIGILRTEQSGQTLSAALLNMEGSFNRSLGINITMWAYGTTVLANNAPHITEADVVTSAGALVRSRPSEETGVIIAQIPVNTIVTANGYSEDAAWARIFVPNAAAVGWVSAESLVDLPYRELALIDSPESGYTEPFMSLFILTGQDDAACAGAPESGVIIQANGRDNTYFVINNAVVRLRGTILIQTAREQFMDVNVLDGTTHVTTDFALLRDDSRFEEALIPVPPGSRARFTLDTTSLAIPQVPPIEPYDQEMVAAAPILLLPGRAVQVPQALPTEQIATQQALAITPFATRIPPTLVPTPTTDMTCVREMRNSADLYAGPGTFFEVTGRLQAGASAFPELKATDPSGVVWWQLINGSWVQESDTIEVGFCQEIPTAPIAPPPPTNVIVLEACEADNGPVRVGQRVTFRFTPPAFATVGEAIAAVRIDPGRITVNDQPLSVNATEPRTIGMLSVIRTFYAEWVAVSGTHRVVAQRLGYGISCDFTVPNE